jgi:hypothetical protein
LGSHHQNRFGIWFWKVQIWKSNPTGSPPLLLFLPFLTKTCDWVPLISSKNQVSAIDEFSTWESAIWTFQSSSIIFVYKQGTRDTHVTRNSWLMPPWKMNYHVISKDIM